MTSLLPHCSAALEINVSATKASKDLSTCHY